MKGFGFLDYAIFVAYMAASVLIGSLFMHDHKSGKDFFLAGRTMGYIPVAISIVAALLSGISYLGLPAEGFAYGMEFSVILFAFFLATPVTLFLFLPFFFRLQSYSAYEYLERRFSPRVRSLCSALFIVRVILWLALATYAPALALNEVTGMPLSISILLTGTLTTVYSTMGGMKGVIWTDVLQFFVLVGGIGVIIWSALDAIPGGFAAAWNIAREGDRLHVFDFSFSLTARLTFWGLFIGGTFMNMVQLATDQVSVQRYLTAKSLRESKKALWLKLFITVPTGIALYFCGVVLFAFYRIHGDPVQAGAIDRPDRILPYFVVTQLPSPLPGVLIAAIFAATMSTISAGINSLSTATIVDFYQRYYKNDVTDARQLQLARSLTLFYGATTIGLAFLVGQLGPLLEASNIILGLAGGPILGVFLLGMLSLRTNAFGVFLGWCAGVVAGLLMVFGGTVSMWVAEPLSHALLQVSRVSFIWYTMLSCLVTVTVGRMSSQAFAPPRSEQVVDLVARVNPTARRRGVVATR
jgi:SSS family transporter